MSKSMFFLKVKKYISKHKFLFCIVLVVLIGYWMLLPSRLFPDVYSTVVLDKTGELLGARIADDGQWRFPEDSVIPEKIKKCVILFEDRHFYQHPGFNPVSIVRAAVRNIKAGKVVNGGSTITMQVIRLYRNGKRRTILEKSIELLLATRLELKFSKERILQLYVSHAPFGGNVIGIKAASWRYFARNPDQLSWAESALIAVLPNSPALIHPGRNRNDLLNKRNRLLKKLYFGGIINQQTYQLSLLEPLPFKPFPLPDLATHYTESLKKEFPGKTIRTTIQKNLQENVSFTLTTYYKELINNYIQNACALIIQVKTGNVLAYVGNIPLNGIPADGRDVDCIQAPRSTGSILKPFLYMAMQQEGLLLPGTLVPDIPTRISGFKPENYDLGYDGAVPASRALARSLNIPAIRMLQSYGIPKFQNILQKLGMSTLVYSPDHYGLTLVVGGAEGKLWDISHMYASLANELNRYTLSEDNMKNDWVISPGPIYLTYEALLEVNRPEEEAGWKELKSARKIAWKTGTSYGFRDAWAIGTTPEYVVGVWVGNADGEGRPGLTGVGVAAPLMFRLFNLLPPTTWFNKPYDDLEKANVCRLSGYRAGPYCDETDTIYVARQGLKSGVCPFHTLVHLSDDSKYRVNSKCLPVDKMIHKHWFVLPPAMEWYYKKKNAFYNQLPSFKSGCSDDSPLTQMELIYPTASLKIFIPREIDGSPGKTVFEMAHRNPDAVLYWHMDGEFLGTTKTIHQLAFKPSSGKHLMAVIDNEGNAFYRRFEVVDKK